MGMIRGLEKNTAWTEIEKTKATYSRKQIKKKELGKDAQNNEWCQVVTSHSPGTREHLVKLSVGKFMLVKWYVGVNLIYVTHCHQQKFRQRI